jgi:cysteine-rich repeat protein
MHSRRLRALFGSLGLAALFAAAVAAQDRPTLERIEGTLCAQAEESGASYRPVFCEPRCDCLAGIDLTPLLTCTETSPGSVTATGAPRAAHDAVCAGECSIGGSTCTENGDCAIGVCNFSVCADLHTCTDSSQCDQTQGFSCVDGFCQGAICNVQGVCATGLEDSSLVVGFGFAPTGSLSPLFCATPGHGNISSADAAACIAQIEAELGAGACVLCGDGNLDAGEQCDDGNLIPGDGCAADCTSEP